MKRFKFGILVNTALANNVLVITVLVILSLAFTSCIGVDAEITVAKDGSGELSLAYHISHELETLGSLDGNQRWPSAALGKADFERTASRIDGLELLSFASVPEDGGVINRIRLGFSGLDSLMAYLNDAGGRAVLKEGSGAGLTLSLSGGGADLDPKLKTLLREALAGYQFRLLVKSSLADGKEKVTEYNSSMADLLLSGKAARIAIDL